MKATARFKTFQEVMDYVKEQGLTNYEIISPATPEDWYTLNYKL